MTSSGHSEAFETTMYDDSDYSEVWSLLVEVIALLLNLVLIGASSALKLLLTVIRSLSVGAMGNSVTLYRREHGESSQYYSANGQSYLRTAQYKNIEIMPSMDLSQNVLQKSWSLAELKSQIDIVQRQNIDLKYKIENEALKFDMYRREIETEISSLNASLEAICTERQALEKATDENEEGMNKNNEEDLELSYSEAPTDENVTEEEAIDKTDSEQDTELQRKRTNFTLCKHVHVRDLFI